MPAAISEIELLPEWTGEGWASYTVPLGRRGLTWVPPPRRPVAASVRAEGASIDKALAELAEPEQIAGGFATVYVAATGPMTWRSPRLAKVESPPQQIGAPSSVSYTQVNAPSAKQQRLAQATLNLAVGELGLRSILPPGRGLSLGWFGLAVLPSDPVLTTGDPGLAGFMRSLEFGLWVRHTLSADEVVRTVSHESRHFQQIHSASCSFADNRVACQRDADSYEDAFWARHGSRLMRLAA